MAGMQAISGTMELYADEHDNVKLSVTATSIIGIGDDDEITVTYRYDVETVLNVYVYDAISQHLELTIDKFREKVASIMDKTEREQAEDAFSHFTVPDNATIQ